MLQNHLIVAWRNLLRNRVTSAINVAGLAIGILVCALIYQYVRFELSYDRFHHQASSLYRVALENIIGDIPSLSATNHPAVGHAMVQDFPEVATSARLARLNVFANTLTLSYPGDKTDPKTFVEERMYLADAPFLTMFSFPLLEGNPATALQQPLTIVISETMKKKYFGNEPAMGKTMKINGDVNLTITGVMKDVPQNSHLNFDALVSFTTMGKDWGYDQWRWPEFYNYIQLKPGANAEALQSKLPAFTDKYLGDVKKEYKWKIRMFLQPVTSIHLTSHLGIEQDVNGSDRTVSFLILLGVFILVVAWINYINLSTARSLERSKEVGLRKVAGASRRQLITQFFFDALLVNALALGLAVILSALTMPSFIRLVGKDITSIAWAGENWQQFLPWIAGAAVLLIGTLVVGAYPALLISSFNPALVLKGKFSKSTSGNVLRQFLVSFQYVLSILLIAGTITIYRQLSFMQHQDLGYTRDQMLILRAPAVYDSTLAKKIDFFRNELSQVPSIHQMSYSSAIPGHVMIDRNGIRKAGLRPEDDVLAYQQFIGEDFLELYHIPMVAGRKLEGEDRFVYDKPTKVLINEDLCRKMGYRSPDEALHEQVAFGMGPNPQSGEIVGVVKDYHQVSLRDGYSPIVYFLPSDGYGRYFSVNLDMSNFQNTLTAIREDYMKAFPDNAFEYFFLDEYFNKQYQGDVRLATIFGIFTTLAIVIACMGLFGLSVFAVIRRTKEVGIRKVLGASVTRIMLLFSHDFVKLLLISYLIAAPAVYFVSNRWLATFAFHITPGWDILVAPLLLLMLISVVTVSIICLKAATANPTKALRQE